MKITRYQTTERMSRLVIHGETIYLCGQVAKDDAADFKGQTTTTLEKIEELLHSVNSDKARLLSVTIYLSDMALFKEMNEVWDAWVEARIARSELLVEMSVIAAK